jgi:hypothetical protein
VNKYQSTEHVSLPALGDDGSGVKSSTETAANTQLPPKRTFAEPRAVTTTPISHQYHSLASQMSVVMENE